MRKAQKRLLESLVLVDHLGRKDLQASTSSTSPLKSIVDCQTGRLPRKLCMEEMLSKELAKAKVPLPVAKYVCFIFNPVLPYAYKFVFEIRHASCLNCK